MSLYILGDNNKEDFTIYIILSQFFDENEEGFLDDSRSGFQCVYVNLSSWVYILWQQFVMKNVIDTIFL